MCKNHRNLKRSGTKIKFFVLSALFFFGIAGKVSAQYGVGDYGSTSSGNYNTIATWSTWNGAAWIPAVAVPNAANSVFILTGSTVTVTVQVACNNLTVEAGGKLWTANSASNIYIMVYGNVIQCNGQIGDGATFDGISFNIEGISCTISGTGLMDISRLRKFTSSQPTTSLIIDRDLNLRFNSASTTQLYNNVGGTNFNITINTGRTVTLFPNGPSTGNVCIDGINGVVNTSAANVEAGGIFTINGSLIVSGILYLTTNNVSPAYTCQWIINGTVEANEVIATASGAALHSLIINAGGKLELTGTPAWSTLSATNNSYNFGNNSTVEYSASGTQLVRVASEFSAAAPVTARYGHLILSGSGNKSTSLTNLYVKNDLTITGSAVLDPNPAINAILVGGNWNNYNATGFSEKTSYVWLNGTSPQLITCPGGETFYGLRYANTGVTYARMNSPVTLINQILFSSNGYLDLNGNTLTVLNPVIAGIQGGNFSRYILSEQTNNSSKISWNIGTGIGTFTFPFGLPPGGAINYIPVYIKKTTPVDVGTITISTYGTPLNNTPWPFTPTNVTNLWADIAIHNAPDNRHWTVDRFWHVGGTTTNAPDSLIFSYRQTELPDSDQVSLNMGAQYWNDTIGYWNRTQYGVPSSWWVAIPGFNIYNTAWTLTSLTSPLPIELLNFYANPEENSVLLSWETASEINNDYFTLEKSVNGEVFYEIGKVPGAGNSTHTLSYDFVDTKPLSGISYYRLKQTDFDGQYSYSQPVPVNFNSRNFISSAFPNPASDKVYISTDPETDYQIIIRNMEGREIKNIPAIEKQRLYTVGIPDLAKGIYFIELKSTYDTQFIKLIKE
jgi:hypothetical protein